MKIYLVNPPSNKGVKMVREGRCMQRKGAWTTVWPPVTLATMAALLLENGFEVKLDDCIVEDITQDKLKAVIKEFKPDMIVINTATASIYSDLKCCSIAKEIIPCVKTVAFGLHVTALTEESFSLDAGIDYIIRGEPEFCLLELAKALSKGEEPVTRIRGISYKENNAVKHNANRGFDEDLNRLPFPAWHLIDVKKYPLPLSGEPFLLVTTSKGCPHSCLFCPAKPFYGSKMRFRKPDLVIDEMQYVSEKLGVKNFLIWSETFTEEREYVFQFCNELLRRKLNIAWVCNSRVDKVDPEMLKLIKQAGCWMIGFGVESSDQEILDKSGKGITVKQIESALSSAKDALLEVTAHVIFGLPGETLETGRKTIEWITRQKIDFAQFYCAVPWPSSGLYAVAKQNGWLTTGDWEMYEQNHYIMDIGTIRPAEVEYLRRIAMRKFYLSLPRITSVLKKIDSFKKARVLAAMLREFISWI